LKVLFIIFTYSFITIMTQKQNFPENFNTLNQIFLILILKCNLIIDFKKKGTLFYLYLFVFFLQATKNWRFFNYVVINGFKNGFWKATAVSKVYEASSTVRQVQKYIRSFLMRRDISRSLRFQDIFHDYRDYGRRTEQETVQENAISSPIPSCGTSWLHQWL